MVTRRSQSRLVCAGLAGFKADPAPATPVHLTPRGRELLRSVEQIYAELEQEWANVIGAAQVQRMRRDLVHVLSDARSGDLPPVRPIW